MMSTLNIKKFRYTDRETLIWCIANAVGAAERNFQRACGADWETAYKADFNALSDTYLMLLADHRPAVHLEPRMVRNPS